MLDLVVSLYWSLVVPVDLAGSLELAVQSRTKPAADQTPLDGSMRPPAEVLLLSYRPLTFQLWFEAVLPKIVFCDVFSLQNVHCLFLLYFQMFHQQ